MLGGAEHGTKVVLLTGSMGAAARRRALLELATGEAGVVIGTHALIEDKVQFHDLGLVVVDEQHRFGVRQRDRLRAKGRAGHGSMLNAENSITTLTRAVARIGTHQWPVRLTPTTRRFFGDLSAIWPVEDERKAMADVASSSETRVRRGATARSSGVGSPAGCCRSSSPPLSSTTSVS